MFKPLPRAFYEPRADEVAPRLLGHYLLRRSKKGLVGGPIVETEAYLADDPACHSYRGETKRNRTMFGPPGYSYVYLIYGMHYCFNAVCAPKGQGEAVLVRAVEVELGEDWMFTRRKVSKVHELTSGPAKLCIAMDIDKDLDSADICDSDSPLFIAENPDIKNYLLQKSPMVTTTRIGISLAADMPLRFYLDKSPFVSKRVPKTRRP